MADTVPEDVPPPDDVIKTAKDALALFSGDLSDYGITCILLDRARSLSSTPPSREWRTIDSAPKDGAGRGMFPGDTERGPEILATDGTSLYLVFWNGHSWDDGDFHDHVEGLTHWQPRPALPSPPVETDPIMRAIDIG